MILADGEDVRDLVPNDEKIRLVHLSTRLEIGGKRNFGCSLAEGEVIAHFDDDDVSAPGRLRQQVALLQASRKAVVGYNAMRFTDGAQWWRYSGDMNYALGTSLCYQRDWWEWHRFPNVMVAEDGAFALAAWQDGQLAVEDAGDLMYATIHAENTSPRQLAGPNWMAL